jgi:hypothetical protein
MMTTFIKVSHTTFLRVVRTSSVDSVHSYICGCCRRKVGVRFPLWAISFNSVRSWLCLGTSQIAPLLSNLKPHPNIILELWPFNCLNLTKLALSTPWQVYFVADLALLYNTMVEESTSYRPVCESQLQTELLMVR